MKTLIDQWRDASSFLNPCVYRTVDNMNPDTRRGLAVAQMKCADDFDAACALRPLKVEWCGVGEKQWDSWWILWNDGVSRVCGGLRFQPVNGQYGHISINDGTRMRPWSDILGAVPVSRAGFPRPVGWHVIE
jgi:hypothetical protein